MPTFKRSDFVLPDSGSEQYKVAKRLSVLYVNLLKGEFSVFARPFNTNIPIEYQPVFTHFMKAAAIVLEEKGDPESYLRAQFKGLRFAGKPPFPQQLHTTNARLRYVEWLIRQESTDSKKVTKDDVLIDEFEMQQKKLRRLMAGTGIFSEKQALRMFRKQFSAPFLRSKGALK